MTKEKIEEILRNSKSLNRKTKSFIKTENFVCRIKSKSSSENFKPIDTVFKNKNGEWERLEFGIDNKYSTSFFVNLGVFELSEDKKSVKWVTNDTIEDVTEKLKWVASYQKYNPENPRKKKVKEVEAVETEEVVEEVSIIEKAKKAGELFNKENNTLDIMEMLKSINEKLDAKQKTDEQILDVLNKIADNTRSTMLYDRLMVELILKHRNKDTTQLNELDKLAGLDLKFLSENGIIEE